MSALVRYPAPRAVAAGAVALPRLYFELEATVVSVPVLEFMAPIRAPREAIQTGAIGGPRLLFTVLVAAATNRPIFLYHHRHHNLAA